MAIFVLQIVSEDVQFFCCDSEAPITSTLWNVKAASHIRGWSGGDVGSRRSRRTAISEEDVCASPPSGSFPLGVRVVEKFYKSKFRVMPCVSAQLLYLLRETVAGNANRNRVGF